MKPEHYIMMAALKKTFATPEEVEQAWGDDESDDTLDELEAIREGEVETDIKADWNRYYESKSVAACINGRWVGWTYWYGGGKHGNPEEIPWMEDAYFLDCVETLELVKLRKFIKQETSA